MLKNMLLLILSIAVYASFGITNFIFILFSMATAYIAARCFKSKHKKLILIASVFVNAGVLIFIKFLPYVENFNIIAPLGISYYTLQVISYLADVYKGKYEPEKNIFLFCLYIMYIPHLFIGPISRYDEMKKELSSKTKFTWNNLYEGSLRIVCGLSKKLVIAGGISIVVGTISGNTEVYNGLYALLAMFLFGIQLYCDFSGGIDVVLGISKILGINLSENFDSPYYAESVKEFWRRWHISLSTWLKEYIYIPLRRK